MPVGDVVIILAAEQKESFFPFFTFNVKLRRASKNFLFIFSMIFYCVP